MKKIIISLLLVISSLSVFSNATADSFDSLFGQKPQFLPEQQAFVFNFEQQGDRLVIQWHISDGYYLYKDKFTVSSATTKLSLIDMPVGTTHYDDYFGEQEVYYNDVELSFSINELNQQHEITFTYQGCADAGLCYPPGKKVLFFDPRLSVITEKNAPIEPSPTTSEQDDLASLLTNDSLLMTLIIFFGLGIGLAFTPCVFPMYPILSGIIVGSGNKLSTKQAFALSFVYVQGMALTYSALGLIVASLGLQFQAYFQHPMVLGSLAVLFSLLALSMFGVLNFQLPSAWQEKLNGLSNQQQGGRFTSVFIMGMISGLVASPCTTAPLSGALIYVAQSGDLFIGGITLYVLSLGMGMPLLLMGISGGKLLPKAGAWMEVIKGIFGFMLLSVVIVLLARFIDELWVNLSWSLLTIALAGYLLHHNSATQTGAAKSIRQLVALVLLIAATVFALAPWLGFKTEPATEQTQEASAVTFIQVKGIDELNQQLALAKAAGKSVMLDFYAEWCIACKDFEHKTFSDPLIKPLLDQMVLIQSDVTANDELDIELQDKMRILGLPTIVMYNNQGIEQKHLRVVGFQKPQQFKATLTQINH